MPKASRKNRKPSAASRDLNGRLIIHNMPMVGYLGAYVDLLQLVAKLRDAHGHTFGEYTPGKFPVVLVRMYRPRVTFSIFSSGKIIGTAARGPEDVEKSLEKLSNILCRAGVVHNTPVWHTTNVVCSCRLDCPVDQEKLERALNPEATHDPDAHPCLTYRPLTEDATFNFYSTGEGTVLGCTTRLAAERAVDIHLPRVNAIIKREGAQRAEVEEPKPLPRGRKKKHVFLPPDRNISAFFRKTTVATAVTT